MARANQQKTIGIKDSNGDPWSGQVVELYNGATGFTLPEVGTSGFYLIASIPPNEYEVYVNSNPQNEFIAVGAGAVDSVDRLANPSANYVTDENGDPALEGPNTVVTSLTIAGTAGTTGAIDTDAVYLRNTGTPVVGELLEYNTDTQQVEASGATASQISTNTTNIALKANDANFNEYNEHSFKSE
jgi:hypothetical protein